MCYSNTLRMLRITGLQWSIYHKYLFTDEALELYLYHTKQLLLVFTRHKKHTTQFGWFLDSPYHWCTIPSNHPDWLVLYVGWDVPPPARVGQIG